jgi:hypothetical protein
MNAVAGLWVTTGAEPRTGSILVVEPESIIAAAYRAWAMMILQVSNIEPQLRQDVSPPALRSLYR